MLIYADSSAAVFLCRTASDAMTDAERVRLLVAAVERYLEAPGCNIPARQTAIARLRWALEQVRPTTHEIKPTPGGATEIEKG